MPTLEGIVGRARLSQERFKAHAYHNDGRSTTHRVAISIPKEAPLDISPRMTEAYSRVRKVKFLLGRLTTVKRKIMSVFPEVSTEVQRVRQVCLKHIKVFKRTLNTDKRGNMKQS